MTRCIHCTRCVRFGEEIAGIRELGATGRGENMCVSAPTSKNPMVSEAVGQCHRSVPCGGADGANRTRYTARAWELQQQPSTITGHDSVGCDIVYVHRQMA